MGRRGALQAYTTGRGRVLLRARYQVEEVRSKEQLVFTEIPYQVRKIAIIEKIVEVVKDGRITGIADVRDESDRDGIRLVVELKKGEDPQVVVNQLFQYTPLQTTYSIINLAISEGRPRTLTLRGLIDAYISHRKDVIRRRSRFLLKKAEERRHIVEGLRLAVDNIDEVIAIIRGSADTDEAKRGLIGRFGLSPAQAQAIVDMRLGRLTGLEREKLEEEHQRLLAEIADLNDILNREERVRAIIREDIDDVEKRYGDARRSEISEEEVEASFDIEELITEEMMVVTFSRAGYVKRVSLDAYRAQGRGGRGIKGSEAKEGDVLKALFVAGTHDYLLCFSNHGQVYWLKVYQLPEGARTSQGRAIRNLLPLEEGEIIQNVLRVQAFDAESSIVFSTKGGTVKKTMLEAYSRPKKGGIRAILLEEGDALVGVALARPGDTIMIGTAKGKLIRFDEAAARAMGRTSRGVRGIRLIGDDKVVGMIVSGGETGQTVFTATENGYGKRTPVEEYPIKGRGGQGVINIKTGGRNGLAVGIALCADGDDVMFITAGGMIVRSPVAEMRPMGRGTQGVRVINLKDGDQLVATEIVHADDLEAFGLNGQEEGAPQVALPAAPPRAAGEDDFEDDDEEDDEDEEDEEDEEEDEEDEDDPDDEEEEEEDDEEEDEDEEPDDEEDA
jgi:DNA gyrase subunit A